MLSQVEIHGSQLDTTHALSQVEDLNLTQYTCKVNFTPNSIIEVSCICVNDASDSNFMSAHKKQTANDASASNVMSKCKK